jgi:hypothetical protein
MEPISSESNQDKNMDKLLQKTVGKDNPLMKAQNKEHEEDEKYKVFCAVGDLHSAARELYCSGDMSWDEMISSLSEAIEKLKGKEKALKAAMKKDHEEKEEDDEDDE